MYQEEEMPLDIKMKLEVLKNKHKNLEVQFYNFRFEYLKKNYQKIRKAMETQEEILKKSQEKADDIEHKNEEILNRFSSMTANFINLIITFAIVTNALSAIEKFTSFQFLPIFVVSLVFLGISSVIISTAFLTDKTKLPKYVLIIWTILFIIFLATIIGTVISLFG